MALHTRAAVLSAMEAPRPYAHSRPLAIETVRLDPPGLALTVEDFFVDLEG